MGISGLYCFSLIVAATWIQGFFFTEVFWDDDLVLAGKCRIVSSKKWYLSWDCFPCRFNQVGFKSRIRYVSPKNSIRNTRYCLNYFITQEIQILRDCFLKKKLFLCLSISSLNEDNVSESCMFNICCMQCLVEVNFLASKKWIWKKNHFLCNQVHIWC